MRPTPSRNANKPANPSPANEPAAPILPTAEKTDWTDSLTSFLNGAPEGPAPRVASGPVGELALTFRHSGWAPTRKIVYEQMQEMKYELTPRRIAAFEQCGADASVECRFVGYDHKRAEYRIRSTKCHDRFCVPCSNEKSRVYRTVLIQHMATKENLSLITLTLKQNDDPLGKVLDRITRHFRCLRQKPLWKKRVKGGAAIIEAKIGEDGKSWNVHFHVVCEAMYIDARALSNLWLQITGDSYIVDVRRVGAKGGAVQYITKYVTKAADQSIVHSPRHLKEAIIGFTGRRLVSTFGNWRGLILSENPDAEQEPPTTASPWNTCGPLDVIIRLAVAGDAQSLAIMRAIAPHKFRDRPPPIPPPG